MIHRFFNSVYEGNLYAWGWNRHHQVSPSTHEVISKPSLVEFPDPVRLTDVAGGGMHSLALDADGHVWSWGNNTYGQLGIGSETDVHTSPATIARHRKVSAIAAGWAHSALLTAAGDLFTFGWGLYHQLGHGSTQNTYEPRSVDALSGLDAACGGPIVQIGCGNWHTACSYASVWIVSIVLSNHSSGTFQPVLCCFIPARTSAGDVYTWGWGRDGQLVIAPSWLSFRNRLDELT